MNMDMIGKKIRDVVSGFEGICTGRCEYLNGCVQYLISPTCGTDGKLAEAHWIDVGRLEVVGEGPAMPGYRDEPLPAPLRAVGGPSIDAPPTSYGG